MLELISKNEFATGNISHTSSYNEIVDLDHISIHLIYLLFLTTFNQNTYRMVSVTQRRYCSFPREEFALRNFKII